MNNLIDIRQVLTQILGFLIMLWILRQFAWGPVLGMLEARRQKIAGEFQEAENRKAEADQMKSRYEQELRGIEAQARARMQEGIAEGQKVAAEIREQAQRDAQGRLSAAQEEISREREKSKELVKEEVVRLAMRTAEKILRQKLDDGTQRQLVSEFINEVGAQR
jgi:F-type H+-transporting ATPase subunit b